MSPFELLWAHIDACERCNGDLSRMCERGETLKDATLTKMAETLAPVPSATMERN